TYWALVNADRHTAATAGLRPAPVPAVPPLDRARSVPVPSTIAEHPGTSEMNRLATMSKETSSVATQAPGGIARANAATLPGPVGAMMALSSLSVRTWMTANSTRTAAARPATTLASGWRIP